MSADKSLELVARLEKAGEPSYALDCAISDWRSGRVGWSLTPPEAYTALMDAALLLVPPHHLWQVKQGIQCQAVVWMLETDYDEGDPPMGYTIKFPALALCIAAIRATAELEKRAGGNFFHASPKADACDHNFRGWRGFEDGNGGEQVCTKCGVGAMTSSLRTGL